MLLFNKPTAISYISKSGDKIYPVIIDIKEGVKSSETLSFMTADSNTGILSVAFMDGETIYNIDDATVVCDIERPDGTDLSIGAVKVADGVVEVPLGVNGTSQPGMYMFDFKIARPGSKTIGVPLVSYTVTQSINTDEIVTQDDRLPVLNDLIVKIQNATSASTQATNECKTATQNSITATNNSIQATNNVNNALKSVNNAIASGTVDLELKQLRTSLNGTLHPTANDRINQMETHLLEATATTVETESSFTTVDATNNGYFEDVKLEGKTLVNMMKPVSYILAVGGLNTEDYTISNSRNYLKYVKTNTDKNPSWIYVSCGKLPFDMLKPNTKYTIKLDKYVGVASVEFKLGDGTKKISNIGVIDANGCAVVTTTSKLVDANQVLYLNLKSNMVSEVEVSNAILLEGDHTNNPPGYYKGLMSVGQDVEEVSVASCDFVGITEFELGGFNGEGYPIENGARVRTSNYIPYANTKLKLGMLGSQEAEIVFYNKNKTKLSNIAWVKDGDIVAVPNNTQYVRVALRYPNDVVIYPSDIKYFKMSCPKDKKPLLYFNPTTETWEKPILREWDTIEKHSDGKYYYHKRSGEVVLNGSENWVLDSTLTEENTVACYLSSITDRLVGITNLICDNLSVYDVYNTDTVGIRGYSASCSILIRIEKSKLNTLNVIGFKAWLKANPTTVVYELAQEEVYECTNIDLMTYSGETNYIINSGAISPKSLLKVHNNISNVVKILQEKVSLLENTFIAGLKSVLSGDMYSLATILYPEDFEQNDNTEQDIMVIPE